MDNELLSLAGFPTAGRTQDSILLHRTGAFPIRDNSQRGRLFGFNPNISDDRQFYPTAPGRTSPAAVQPRGRPAQPESPPASVRDPRDSDSIPPGPEPTPFPEHDRPLPATPPESSKSPNRFPVGSNRS